MTPATQIYKIGDLASATGVRIETIRYFERVGLLSNPKRTEGGQRLYSAEDFAKLKFVRFAREMGFTQANVRLLLSLSSGESIPCDEVKAIAESRLATIRQQIASLAKLEELLSSTVARCTGGQVKCCAVIDAIAAGEPAAAA